MSSFKYQSENSEKTTKISSKKLQCYIDQKIQNKSNNDKHETRTTTEIKSMPKQEASATATVPPSQKKALPIYLPLTLAVCATTWSTTDRKPKNSVESKDEQLALFQNKPDSNIGTKQSLSYPESKLAGLSPTELKEPNRTKLPWRRRILVTPAESLSTYSESFFITPTFDSKKSQEPPSSSKPPPNFVWSRPLTGNKSASESSSPNPKSIFNTNETDSQYSRTYFLGLFNNFKTDDAGPDFEKLSATFSQFRPPQIFPESPAPYSKLFFSDHFTGTEKTKKKYGWKDAFPRPYAPLTPSAESYRKTETSIYTQTSLTEIFSKTSSNTSIAEQPVIQDSVLPFFGIFTCSATAANSGSENPSEKEQSFKFPWTRAISPDLKKTQLPPESESPNFWANTLSKPNLSTDNPNRSSSFLESAVECYKSKLEWCANNRSGLIFFTLWYLMLALDYYMNWWPASWLFRQPPSPPSPAVQTTTPTQSTSTSKSESASS